MEERWSEADARAVLEQWRRSGEPLAVFARERGIAPPRLYWWRRKVGFESTGKPDVPQPVLLPVKVVTAESEHPSEPIEVELRNGHLVRVRAGFDEDTLRRVLALLGEATC
jgi:transposase-like protein